MIDAATSVLPSPHRRPPAPASQRATDGFRATLDTVAEKPAARPDVARPPTGRRKQADAPASPPDTDTVDVADVLTGDTSRPGKGQAIAGGGKTLPAEIEDDEPKALIWLPVGMTAPLPTPATCPLVLPTFGGAVAPGTGAAPVTLLPSPAEAVAQLGVAGEGTAPSPGLAPASAGESALESSAIVSNDGAGLPKSFMAAKAELAVPADAAVPAAPATVQPVTQPAGQAFAAAIAAAVQAQPRRDEREHGEPRAPLAIASAAMAALHTPAIAATADASQAALDLQQDGGLQGMIDHIELLRDNADAGDTRIRLVPDALGAVDVSVRKEGERVHVHFNAENAASARLLSEAQPRLADLAEARGVKLGQTSVDSNAGHARQQPHLPIRAAAPADAPHADAADIVSDIRIA